MRRGIMSRTRGQHGGVCGSISGAEGFLVCGQNEFDGGGLALQSEVGP